MGLNKLLAVSLFSFISTSKNISLDIALESYKKGKISISTAVDICNLSKRDFLFKLEDNNISYINSNKKDLAKSIKDLKKEILKK